MEMVTVEPSDVISSVEKRMGSYVQKPFPLKGNVLATRAGGFSYNFVCASLHPKLSLVTIVSGAYSFSLP